MSPAGRVILLWCAVAACTGKPAGEETARPPIAAGEPSAGETVAREQDPAPAEDEPVAHRMPGPYRPRLDEIVPLNSSCESCHDKQAREWRASLHRSASVDAAYRAALAVEPSAFCRGCHAPEADPRNPALTAAARLGVACVTCHVTEEGSVLAAERPDHRAAPAPHAVHRSTDFATTGGCAGCHEFRFPGATDDGDGHFMQTTVRELMRSAGPEAACADCHMPEVDGARSHSFSEVRDPAWLRQNLQARVERVDRRLRVTLAQVRPSHAFPTGDLFRRLEVAAELRGADGRVVRRHDRHLARHFQVLPGKAGRQLVRDDRVQSEPVVVELELGDPVDGSGAARWWVTYQRVATVGVGTDPAKAKVESEVELHSGEVSWDER